MSETIKWCLNANRLKIFDKQVFYVNRNGTKVWYFNGERHRTNGPAVEYINGDKYWWLNDKLHRENGPAVEYANGSKYWYLDGKRHRINGPAVEYVDGIKYWFLDGIGYSESDYWKELYK